MVASLTYNQLLSLPELCSVLRLEIPERNELPQEGRHEPVLFSFEEYLDLLSCRRAYEDNPIVDRARGLVVSQPLTHTFFPALFVLLDDEIKKGEKSGIAFRDQDYFFWHDIILRIQQDPISRSAYPVWRALTEEFLRGGYFIHHGYRNEAVCICSASFEPDRYDRTIFRVLDVRSESHHFDCRSK